MKLSIQSKNLFIVFSFFVLPLYSLHACSTFKLQKNEVLIYGHNLNQGDIGVPGMIFINKRGILKKGRTWSELINKKDLNPSSFKWISRYGSVTFNVFGQDFPDGGINEAGLYVWEMSEDADYIKNDTLPKLNQMNWIQFVLDSYSTIDEVIESTSQIEIEGWGWHYFIGDAKGDCAALAFIDGEVVTYRDETLPVPGLFNSPYERELELMKYYKGFGGLYEPDLTDPEVPRFVKTAILIDQFQVDQNGVDYGFHMLKTLQVNDAPEWSILVDVPNQMIYYKTRIHPTIKTLVMDQIDFSNQTPVLILNMDTENNGNVSHLLSPVSRKKIYSFLNESLLPILPGSFFKSGGLTAEEYLDRFSNHRELGVKQIESFICGSWETNSQNKDKIQLTFTSNAGSVSGNISISKFEVQNKNIEHLQLIGNRLNFTFRTKKKILIEVNAIIRGDQMKITLDGIEEHLGAYTLYR